MKSAKLIRRTTLSVEALEDRCVPAGNVTVTGFGDIVVTGDNAGNEIRVVFDDRGVFELQAGRIEGLNGTTINGESSLAFTGSQLWIDAAAGDDVLTFEYGAYSRGTLRIDTGEGDDRVDVRLLDFTELNAIWTINTGNGDDAVSISGLPGFDLLLMQLVIATGNGNDRVAIEGSFVVGHDFNSSVNLGNGDDELIGGSDGQLLFTGSLPRITGGNGADSVMHPDYFKNVVLPLVPEDFETVIS